jgi:hypothetical protein
MPKLPDFNFSELLSIIVSGISASRLKEVTVYLILAASFRSGVKTFTGIYLC